VFHATDWAGLHESISVLDVGTVLLTGESAGEVSVVSEDVWVVLSPLEINVEKNNFLLIDICEFSRLLLDIWLSIVVEEDIIWIVFSIWVHDIGGEWLEENTFTFVFKFGLWEGTNLNQVLSVYLVVLTGSVSTVGENFVVWVVLEGNPLFLVISGVGHTVTLNEKLGGSLW
jgi:hypothetical protein